MKKKNILIIAVVAIIALVIVAGIIFFVNGNKDSKTNLKIESAEDLSNLVNEIYKGKEESLPKLNTQIVDVSDANVVKSVTGLENGDKLKYLVVSEPMMSSQAYSLVLAQVKDKSEANNIAKMMLDNIDTRKWICVSAEKVYATNSGDVVCLVMSNEEWAKPVYESFKSFAKTVGKEYTKEEEMQDLPDELLY